MNLKHVGAVFERVFDGFPGGGKLLLLPDRNEPFTDRVCNGRSDDESPSLDTKHHVDGLVFEMMPKRIDHRLETGFVLQQRSDVVEVDAWLGKIRHFSDETLEFFH